jgi:hypothetical protein
MRQLFNLDNHDAAERLDKGTAPKLWAEVQVSGMKPNAEALQRRKWTRSPHLKRTIVQRYGDNKTRGLVPPKAEQCVDAIEKILIQGYIVGWE